MFGDDLSDLDNDETLASTRSPSPVAAAPVERAIPPGNNTAASGMNRRLATMTSPDTSANRDPDGYTNRTKNHQNRRTPATTTSSYDQGAHSQPAHLSVPVHVRDNVPILVPYHAAHVAQKYKARISGIRYTLRFGHDGHCHYVREFPA